jgi:hypothetical protein
MSGFKFPKNWDNGLVRAWTNNARWDGVRKCNTDGGEFGFGINTSRLSDFTATYSDFLSYNGRYQAGTTGAVNSKQYLVCGIANIHSQGIVGDDVVYWSGTDMYTDSLYISTLLKLPYFTMLGNTPVSTTDRDLLTKQIYEAGMWIWRDGNLPPISTQPLLNFQFDDDYCYDTGAGPMRNQIGNAASGVTGSVNGTTTNMYGVKEETGNPWMGTWTNDGNGYIDVAQTITPSAGAITHEWIGKRNDSSGNEYISDARNGTGTWILTEYNGYDFNWSNQLQVNNGNGYTNRHWACMTADNTGEPVSRMYYGEDGSVNWAGQIATGGVTSTMVGVGTNFRIGTRYTDSARWNGYMGMYRIWDGALTEKQAEICWLHERYKVYTP